MMLERMMMKVRMWKDHKKRMKEMNNKNKKDQMKNNKNKAHMMS